MFRKRFSFAFALFAASVLALALAAQSANAKDTKNINTSMDILSATSLGGKPVKPGTYRVVADGSTVTLKDGKRVVAEAPAVWKDSPYKAGSSSVVVDGQGIKEFHFEGKASYLEVQE